MDNMTKRLIYITLILLVGGLSANAQKRVESAVKTAEKHNSTQYCAYSERRDPATRKVQRSSKVLVVTANDAKSIRKAMDNERDKAISVELVDGGRVYSLTFYKSNIYSVYTLVQQRNNTWLLTIEQYMGKRKGTRVDTDTIVPIDFDIRVNEILLSMQDN